MSDSLPALKTKPKQLVKRLTRSPFSRRLITAILAFLILAPTVLLLFRPPQASAVWFDDNYGYRQKFSFAHNTDISSERRITVTIDTASLLTAGVLPSNCADTRFTDINGKLLRYQLTGTCNNSSTTYDVVFPSIINGTNVGYVYYGNPIAASRSDDDVSQVTALTPSGGAPSITSRANEEKGQTPVLSWKFDEGYGTTAYDGSQYQNNGTLTSGPTWQNEDLCLFGGKCLLFDGSNDNVEKTYSSDTELDVGTASMSASLWYKHPSSIAGTQYLISRYTTTATAGGYKLYMNSTGVVCFGIDDDSTWTPDDEVCDTSSTADSKWHQVEAVKSEGSDSITLYVDGKQVNQKTSLSATGSLSGNSPTFYVGIDADGTSSPWNGFIDQVKIYNFSRTADQAKTDFTNKGSVDTVSASIGSPDPYASLNQGLVGYWKMDDGVGNTCAAGIDKACDSSGNGNVGTWTNGTASTSGKFGFATNFDGVDDSIHVPQSSSINIGDDFTISWWMKTSDTCGSLFCRAIISKDIGGCGSGDFFVSMVSGVLSFWNGAVTACNALVSNVTVNDGSWHHIVLTRKMASGRKEIYIDGKLDNSEIGTTISLANSVDLSIGSIDGSGNFYAGQLDDVRVYNRALSPSEVSRLYDWGPGPVGYWKLDERTGTQAFDSSGNVNTGTLTNGPTWTTGKFGSALDFDGINDYVQTPAVGEFQNNDAIGSISMWVKSDTPSETRDIFSTVEGRDKDIWIDGGSFGAGVYDGVSCRRRTGGTVDNNWHHLVFIWDRLAGDTFFYVDGTLVSSNDGATWTKGADDTETVYGSGDLTNSNACEITGSVTALDGAMDDVRVYNYALTPKQIVSAMNADHPAVGSPVGSAVAHWKFDEGYGATANNSGSNGSSLNGTLSGTTFPSWRNEGKFGRALNFSGSTAYLDMGNPSAAQITSDLSLSAWVYLSTNTANQDIIAKRDLSAQWGYRLWVDSTGTPKIDVSSTGNVMATASASQTLSTNQWYHLVGTYSVLQSAITIYINGVQKGQTTVAIPNAIQNSSANLNVGREAGSVTPNYLNGSLDEVKLYNYALSADEVKVEYNQGKAVVLGSLSTDPDGITASNSAARAYCPPGDTATCNPPVGHWTLDERQGLSANDISGNGNTGTLTNGPRWTTGKVSQALQFDGADDYIDLGAPSVLTPATALTISAWIKSTNPTQGTSQSILKKSSSPDLYTLRVQASTGKMKFIIATSGQTGMDGTTVLAANTWYHVAGVWDGSNMFIYVNGVSDATPVSKSGTITDGGQSISIGRDPINNNTFFNGSIDDVRIYNYARTPAQIAWEFNQGKPIAHWKFDECTGTTAYDTAPKSDPSATRYDGTVTPGGSGHTTAGTCSSGTSTEMWNDGTNGKFNASLGFDGTDDYVEVADTANLRFDSSSQDFSLFVWVKRTTTGTEYIFSKEDADDDGWRMQFNASNQVLCSEDATDVTSTSAITDTNWHLIGCTIDRDGNGQIYIDGVANGSTVSMGTDAMATTSNIRIGTRSYTSTSYFNGLIDDVRLYPYVLTPTQIRTVYNQDSAVRFGPLTGMP